MSKRITSHRKSWEAKPRESVFSGPLWFLHSYHFVFLYFMLRMISLNPPLPHPANQSIAEINHSSLFYKWCGHVLREDVFSTQAVETCLYFGIFIPSPGRLFQVCFHICLSDSIVLCWGWFSLTAKGSTSLRSFTYARIWACHAK